MRRLVVVGRLVCTLKIEGPRRFNSRFKKHTLLFGVEIFIVSILLSSTISRKHYQLQWFLENDSYARDGAGMDQLEKDLAR